MLDFKAKMHQIQFPLGFRPRPRWGSLERSPRPSSCISGIYFKGRGGKGRGREGESRGGKGMGGLAPNWGVWIRQ